MGVGWVRAAGGGFFWVSLCIAACHAHGTELISLRTQKARNDFLRRKAKSKAADITNNNKHEFWTRVERSEQGSLRL